MKSTKFKSVMACILALGMVYSFGCIFDPKPDEGPDIVDPVDWPDLTDKDDVIVFLLLTYKHRDGERYAELLHDQYLWFMQDRDAEELNIETLDYTEDVESTKRLFKRAVMLELEIDPGSWVEIEAVGEVPCPGCWQTDRVYRIRAQIPGDEKTYTGNDLVKFIVVPVEKDGKTRYEIRWAYDIDYY
ncbi:MAG TPA: hypothetical protein VMX58_04720 [Patescibacteria group bacterium]|nr:hypothetical protein [Patescibacteria group bacterium]